MSDINLFAGEMLQIHVACSINFYLRDFELRWGGEMWILLYMVFIASRHSHCLSQIVVLII